MSNYPGTIDSFLPIAGTSLVATTQTHSSRHNTEGSAVVAIENVLGTTAGTSVLKNFLAGNFAEREGTLSFGTVKLPLGLAPTSGQTLFYDGTSIIGTTGSSSPLTTKGDLYTRNSTADTRLAVVSDGRILSSDSAQVTGLSWVNNLNTFQFGTVTTNVFGAPAQSSVMLITNGLRQSSYVLTDNVGTIDMSFGGSAAPQLVTLTIGTAAGNRLLDPPTGLNQNGYEFTMRIKQNAAATGTLVWNASYRFSSDVGTPTLGTAATWNYYRFIYGTIDSKWDFQYQSKNII